NPVERERLRRAIRSRNQPSQGHVFRRKSITGLKASAPLPAAGGVLFDGRHLERRRLSRFAALRAHVLAAGCKYGSEGEARENRHEVLRHGSVRRIRVAHARDAFNNEARTAAGTSMA